MRPTPLPYGTARTDLGPVRTALPEESDEQASVPDVDLRADRAVYKQLADRIRAQIQRGDYAPGQRLPSEKTYVQEHGLSRVSVSKALAVLRGEGLITTTRGGSYVRDLPEPATVCVEQGTISARMPTAPERRAMDIDDGVPLLIVQCPHQEQKIYPADRTEISVSGRF
jgi:DNA-binding GntR family transcriptional regulator